MAEPAATRRAALRTLIASLLGGFAVWRYLSPRSRGAAETLVRVPLAEVPVGGALVLPQHRCAILRTRDEVSAIDLTCTHLGCAVVGTRAGFACPCHGSRFDRRGRVLSGPAPSSLRSLEARLEGGHVRVLREPGARG